MFADMIPSLLMMFFIGIVFGLICRAIAGRKGYGKGKFFALGFFTWIIGLIIIAALPLSKALREKDLIEAMEKAKSTQEPPAS